MPPTSSIKPSNESKRRGSDMSLSSQVGQQRLTQELDDIHSSASQSGGLTSFNEFSSPPSASRDRLTGRLQDGIPLGFGSFYNRLRASVGPYSPSVPAQPNQKLHGMGSGASVGNNDQSSMPSASSTQAADVTHSRTQSRDSILSLPDDTHPSSSSLHASKRSHDDHLSPAVSRQEAKRPLSLPRTSPDLTVQEPEQKASKPGDRKAKQGPKTPSPDDSTGKVSDQATDSPTRGRAKSNVAATLELESERTLGSALVQSQPQQLRLAGLHGTVAAKSNPTLSADGQTFSPRFSQAASSSGTASPSERSLSVVAPVKPSPTMLSGSADVSRGTQSPAPNDLIYQMQHKVLSKDFWMKDENAKVCFNCGDNFTTFRRKHHCRLCGQIYCNNCTNLISGKPFGKSNKLRVCKTCNNMLHEDDSSDCSEDDPPSTPQIRQIRFSVEPDRELPSPARSSRHRQATTPSPSPGVSSGLQRRLTEGSRPNTGSITFEDKPTLSRPSSSRSLKTLSGRPRSSSHKPRRPRSQHMRSLSIGPEGAGLLRRRSSDDRGLDHLRTAQRADSVVDPELHPFLSDEGSSDEDTPTIASNLGTDMNDGSNAGFGVLNAIRKARPRPAGMSIMDGFTGRDPDPARGGQPRRKPLARSVSAGSMPNVGSGRLGKSDNLFKSSDNLYAMIEKLDPQERTEGPQNHLRSQSPAKAQDGTEVQRVHLDLVSLRHLKRLFYQCLEDAKVEIPGRWENSLIPVLLRCAESVDPNVQRGDRIDIRTYVKIKKVPGGSPRNTTIVDGIVFTNNVALKDMSRLLTNPRVLLISFPLIYARHQHHFMSLEGVVAQEEEYLRNLSSRIRKLQPNLVLVQGEVAGIVRKNLQAADMTIVHDVKASVLQAAARFTQTRVVSSVDKLTMSLNQLGSCGLFEVKTFVYGSSKRSYIYVSGCPRDLGCTIILRGADAKVLKKLKWASEFLAYVAYNLKLETSLMRDQFAVVSRPGDETTNDQNPPPGDTLDRDKKSGKLETYDDIIRYLRQRVLSASPLVRLPEPYLLRRGHEQEVHMSRLKALQKLHHPTDSTQEEEDKGENHPRFELIRPEMVYAGATNTTTQVREVLRAIHSAEYERATQSYAATKRRWDAYLAEIVDPFSPFIHQKIVVQHSIVSNATSDACIGPELVGFEYYQEHDIDEGWERDMPLGEYIERLCGQAESNCTAGRCDGRMVDHHRQYVHGSGQVMLHMKKRPPRFKDMENTILMWSVCGICGYETQVAPMSSDAWKYSFGKYLELCFWNSPLHPRAASCNHDINRDHERFFGFRNLCVQVRYTPISLVEVTVPRSTISWIVGKDLAQKNDIYQRLEGRIRRYTSSVKLRLKSIKPEAMTSEKLESCKSEVETLTQRADKEFDMLVAELQELYMSSRYYETVPLNKAFRSLQQKVAEWDTTFAEFEANYFPSGRDLRKLAAIQFRKTFLEKEGHSPHSMDDEKLLMQSLEPPSAKDSPLNEKTDLENHSNPPPAESNSDERRRNQDLVAALDGTDHQQRTSLGEEAIVQTLDLATDQNALSPTKVHESGLVPTHDASPSAARTGLTSSPLRKPKMAAPLEVDVASRVKETSVIGHELREIDGQTSPSPAGLSPVPMTKRAGHVPPLLRSQTSPNASQLNLPQAESDPPRQPIDEISRLRPETQKPGNAARHTLQQRLTDKAGTPTIKIGNIAMQSMIPRATGSMKDDSSRVSALAKHFEQMSRQFERERLRERRVRLARTRQSRAFPASSVNPILKVFRDANEAVREREMSQEVGLGVTDLELGNDLETDAPSYEHSIDERPWMRQQQEDGSIDTSGDLDQSEESTLLRSYPGSEGEAGMSDAEMISIAEQQDLGQERPYDFAESPTEVAKQDTTILNKILSSLWSEQSASGWSMLEYPLTPGDHMFADSDLIVREDEPSSLIAFALASRDYVRKMQKFRDRAKAAEQEQKSSPISPTTSDDVGVESVLLGKTATHMKYQFDNGPARLQCKVFYAESFDAIRRKCGIADRFVNSLSRCVKLDSKGGKSKSLFLQTHDKRFILKSLSQVEVQAFLKFAPDYFDFMSKCLFHNLPSSLTKMLGLYQIVIKNPVTGMDFSWFLQVMENVFYEGEPSRKFDLKGSMRNRKAEVTGKPDEVLLDENFLDFISHNPLHVRYHTSALLNNSITNDTLFCSKQNVMDYSLIIGLYEDKKEVVVGIIDYIRTYTWDKKLESWIKDRGSRKATVRSPKEYRNRFRRSIPTYFPHAPSTWQVFGTQRIDPGRMQLEELQEEEDDALEEQQSSQVPTQEESLSTSRRASTQSRD